MNYIFTSEECWKYECFAHPEAPFRVKDSYQHLRNKKDILNFEFVYINDEIDEEILLWTHTKSLIEQVKNNSFYDADTPNLPNIFHYAKISANIVLHSMKSVLNNNKSFALTRPPGHHATSSQLGGFCYFNNIAVAINWYLKNFEDKKVAILDIDVHHGNGTEEIFLGNKRVLFISLHQMHIYPGSGLKSRQNCINFPLFAQTEDKEYLKVLNSAIEKIKEFNPDILGVSCGFDTYKNDPLAGLSLSENCYYEIGKAIKEINLPTFCVLEGGYSKQLPVLIEKFLSGFF